MSTDPKRIEVRLDADPRLATAAGGAVRYLAESAGMPEEVCREFQEETVRACLQAFQAHPALTHAVEILVFADRLEVAIQAKDGSPAIRLTRSVVPQR